MIPRRQFLRASAIAGVGLLDESCAVDVAPKGRTAVSLWFSYGGTNREVLESLVRRFNLRQSRDFVQAVYQGDYFEGLAKLRTAIAARCAPVLSHVVGEVVPYLAEAGVLEPLADYPGVRDLDLIPELGQAGTWTKGSAHPLCALPFNRSTPIAYLNAELFGQAGLAAPRTWDELRAVAKRLTEPKAGGRFGFGCPVNWWFWVALLGQAGGSLVTESGRIALGDQAGVEALVLWQELVRDGLMKPPPGRDYNAWEQCNQDFLSGRAAMIWSSTAFLKYLEAHARFKLIAAPLPAGVKRAVPTGGTFWVVLRSAPSAEKAAAVRFLRFMHEPEQVIEWSTRTGYIPVTRGAVRTLEQRGYYAAHPNDRVALEQLSVAEPWPWSVDLFRIQREIVQPRLESAVVEQRDPSALLTEARALALEPT
ncbi:MAG TPA: ABC transporter substrate-binding protein [Polyangiaceae bacterium]|nr:ABC transporter substrate-binding protein [Polyangiaceae bacterium]